MQRLKERRAREAERKATLESYAVLQKLQGAQRLNVILALVAIGLAVIAAVETFVLR